MQRELTSFVDMDVKLYYEKVPHEGDRFVANLHELMEMVMEHVLLKRMQTPPYL
jgi:hypothetical protein